MIELTDISMGFTTSGRKIEVIRNLSMVIGKGEILCIRGSSGSGKSTLLSIIGLLERPLDGNYTLDGKNLFHLNEEQKAKVRFDRFGYLFQSYRLIHDISVLDNVLMHYRMMGKKFAKSRRDEAVNLLETFGLQDRIHHFPAELSGGEAQRVALARAVIKNPDILLADEPTANLDSHSRDVVLSYLSQIMNRERIIIIVTHDDYVASFGDRLFKMP